MLEIFKGEWKLRFILRCNRSSTLNITQQKTTAFLKMITTSHQNDEKKNDAIKIYETVKLKGA